MALLSPFETNLVEAFRQAVEEVAKGNAPSVDTSDEALSEKEIAFLRMARQFYSNDPQERTSIMSAALFFAENLTANVEVPGGKAADESAEMLRRTNERIVSMLGSEFALSL